VYNKPNSINGLKSGFLSLHVIAFFLFSTFLTMEKPTIELGK
jgi:hypothetical protein